MAVESIGFQLPQSAANINTAGPSWLNPTNILDRTVSRASCDVDTTPLGDRLYASNFDFSSLPSNAEIKGIELQIRRDTENATYPTDDSSLYLMSNSTTTQGSNMATYLNWSTTVTTVSYGGPTNLWGWTSITASDIKDSNFGIGFGVVGGYTIVYNAWVEYVEMKVYFERKGAICLALGAF